MPEEDFFFRLEVVLNGLVTKSVIVRRDDKVLDATRFDFDLVWLEVGDETCLESLALDINGDAQPEVERAIAIAARAIAERQWQIGLIIFDEDLIKGSLNSLAGVSG